MKQQKKSLTVVKYNNGNLPDNFSSLLENADENELKALIGLLILSDDEGKISPDIDVASFLGIESADFDASVNFWRGAGIIGAGNAKKTEKSQKSPPKGSEYAHKSGAVEKTVGVVEYLTGELADILENRKEIAAFVDEAQRIVGKTLNMNEIGILVGLIDQYGFEPAALLAVLLHTTKLGKKGMRYPEKGAISLYDEGLVTEAGVLEKIRRIDSAALTISKIKDLFGVGSRALSTSEKNLFKKWTEDFGYDIEVIRKAYDITIDVKHEPIPKYTNGILEKWYVEKLRTVEDIEAYEAAKKGKKEEQSSQKSYDINEFIDAAIKRSFDDID